MRPPILKNWHRTTIEYRGIYVNRYGIGSQGGDEPTDIEPLPEGDNYAFIDDDGPRFSLRDMAGDYYIISVRDPALMEVIFITPASGIAVPLSEVPAVGSNWEFTTDRYFRHVNENQPGPVYHHISANPDESLNISVAYPSMFAAFSKRISYNALFTDTSFFWKDLNTGVLYKPWIVETSPNIFAIEVTEQ